MIDILRLSVPITVWLVSFSAVYGLHGIVCAAEWAGRPGIGHLSLGHVLLLAASAMAVLVQAGLMFAIANVRVGGPRGFTRRTSLALAVTALVATVWTLFPVAVLPMCR